MNEKKFIAAGSCRRVFSLGDGTCVKVAISERREAGKKQNEAEFACMNSKDSSGNRYTCFPNVFSSSEDFDSIIVEEVENAEDYTFDDAFGKYVDMNVICSKDFKRIDRYQGIAVENSFCRWFAFVFCGFVDLVVDRLKYVSEDEVTLESVQNFLSSYPSIANSNGFPQDIGSLVDTTSKFLNEMMSQKSSNCAFKSLYDLLDFYIAHGKEKKFVLADLWNESQWGVRRNKQTREIESFVVLDAGYSQDLADSEHYRREKTVPIQYAKMTYPRSQPNMFDGKILKDITSPKNGHVISKFYTKSEYILTDDGMSTHIKNLGLPDDGRWPWSDKMIFVSFSRLSFMMRTIKEHMTVAKKLTFHDEGVVTLEIPDGSESGWHEVLRIDGVRYTPCVGFHVCEFTFDGFDGKSGVMKQYHPGHDITWIETNEHI